MFTIGFGRESFAAAVVCGSGSSANAQCSLGVNVLLTETEFDPVRAIRDERLGSEGVSLRLRNEFSDSLEEDDRRRD